MKWKTKVPGLPPEVGDKRQRQIFAVLTHKCRDGYTRWLENILIEETLIEEAAGDMDMPYYIQYWKETGSFPISFQPKGE